jgi:tetratricopeptide (TPR) repeat protein
MRSLPSGRRRRRNSRLLAAALGAVVAGGCAGSTAVQPTHPPLDPAERPYLISPVAAPPRPADPELMRRLGAAFEAQLLAGDAPGAVRVATDVLRQDADLDAGRVLLGQGRLVAGDLAGAREALEPVAVRFPDYAAARLAAARVAERLGDLVEAYAGYRGLAHLPVAAERARELHARALEVLGERIADAVRRGRLEEARQDLARLREWAPTEPGTFEAALAVARAAGDDRAELEAVRGLLAGSPGDEALMERRGELELAVGEPRAAIDLYEELVRRHPREPRLADRLELAKFRWRLANLPEEVGRLVNEPELTRADFAVLLYWLVPGVRAGVASSPRIATDVLDHPQRQAIVRVINLQLMDVDENLRRFEPDARLRRASALRALLRVLQRSPSPPSCVAPLEANPSPSREAVCAAAAACGLLAEPPECLPDAGVSGREAADWIRLAAALLPS